MKQKIGLVVIALTLSACAARITGEDVIRTDFGERPTNGFTTATIRRELSATLIDPGSLQLRCADPRKGWVRPDVFAKPLLGFVVLCGVNAKNRFGGYTGETPYVYLFNMPAKSYYSKTGSTPDRPIENGQDYGYIE